MDKITQTINKLNYFAVKNPKKAKLIKSLIAFIEEHRNGRIIRSK